MSNLFLSKKNSSPGGGFISK
jgi:hypothetical protein